MSTTTRFGKKLKVPSTFQLKHQFLLWWLTRQAAIEAAEDSTAKTSKNAAPMHVHEATF